MQRIVTLVLLAALAGCAGVPGLAARPLGRDPRTDAVNTWFTGVGTSRGGDRAEAEEIARADLIDASALPRGEGDLRDDRVARASVDDYRTRCGSS